MDRNKLKETIEQITMPADMQERIIQGVKEDIKHSQKAEKTCDGKKKRSFKTCVLIAATVACLVTAAAVGGKALNPTIISNMQTLSEYISQNDISSYSVTMPNSRTPHSLEEMIKAYTFKSQGWLSEETTGGSIRSEDTWTSMEIVQADGDVKKRVVYAESGAVKTEYTAQNPQMLQSLISGEVSIDFAALNQAFEPVPYANQFYQVTDKKRQWGFYLGKMYEVGTYVEALYKGPQQGSYFTLNCTNTAEANQMDNAYIAADSYDQIYHYTNTDGIEFIIEAYGDCVWAECIMEHSEINLYGGYMSTDQVESILDHIHLTSTRSE